MGNCLVFALRMWWRHGGRIECARSPHLKVCPRFKWTDGRHRVSYTPGKRVIVETVRMHWANPLRYTRVLCFKGRVSWG
jgi:hypothetical protein